MSLPFHSPLDPLSRAERSERMGHVRNKDTKPEMVVRRLVHSLGYRYRLHVRRLPGQPDLLFPSRKKVIFVHGCFWHRHARCRNARLPKTRHDFWIPKLEKNRERDRVNRSRLRGMGYKILVVWECQLKKRDTLCRRIIEFLDQEN